MRITFEDSLARITLLVRQFSTNAENYRTPGYLEAHARQEFIDPMFEALGWDVRNQLGATLEYREVIFEDRVEIAGQKKAPDYAFRIGRERKFFVEAKRPGTVLKHHAEAAYQLRRYAWSAKLPLSILTDFEELAIYSGSIKPALKDKANVARIQYFTYTEYPARWKEIWDIFSHEAVLNGSYDQYANAGKSKRGANTVDSAFLKEIESWRLTLARHIAIRNPVLTSEDLNFVVQQTIDRIIFLRMAEDRGSEEYGRLQRVAENDDAYPALLRLYRAAGRKYNAGLFDFSEKGDTQALKLAIDDKVLRPILSSLYFPQSPYEFSVLPVELLGNVYEQFLGKVIRLTEGHHAKVEDKPEVKKAGGVFYTPRYIVDHVVQHTLEPLVASKGPDELRGLRVLDPACGSGSFLLGAYQYFLNHYLDWYLAHTPAHQRSAVWRDGETWRLTTTEKRRILVEHIFGVDLDRQAVEVTKLSLLLKVLEGESERTLQLALFDEQPSTRILPNLDRNIQCGNSLIGAEYWEGRLFPETDELLRIHPFDWATAFPEALRAGGFDAVLGNPPYVRIQILKDTAPQAVEFYKHHYTTANSGNYDLYILFVEKGMALLNHHGRLGFILPSKFFATDYGAALRKMIAQKQALSAIIDFGHAQVFENATTYTTLLFLGAEKSATVGYAKIATPSTLTTAPPTFTHIPTAQFTEAPWYFSTPIEATLIEKVARQSIPLSNLPTRIGRGSSSGADDIFVLHKQGRKITTQQGAPVDIEAEILRVPVYATDFSRYAFSPKSGDVILFPYDVTATGYQVLAETELQKRFPKAYSYLLDHKKQLLNRKQYKHWYAFSASRNLEVHITAHLLVPLLANRGLYCRLPHDTKRYCLMASGGFSITIHESSGLSPNYVLGLLNSRLLFWRLASISNVFRGGWITCTKQYVETLPIRQINFTDPDDVSRYDRIIKLVERRLALSQQLTSTDSATVQAALAQQIESVEHEIDQVVYALYELTPEEIHLVEDASS